MAASWPLLPRQRDLLRFIAGYLEAHDGIAPSLAECAAGLGLESKSSAHRLLSGLEARSAIRRLPHRVRAIELLRPVAVPRAPDGSPLYFVPLALPL